MIHRLSAPESAALGCRFVVEVELVVDGPIPPFIRPSGKSWRRHNVAGKLASKEFVDNRRYPYARPATEEEQNDAD